MKIDAMPVAELIAKLSKVTADLDAARHDIQAYRGALGYSIPGDHTGKLTNGTVPLNGLCDFEYRKNLEAERDAAQAACAEKDSALRFIRDECDWESDDRIGLTCDKALSTSYGHDFIPTRELEPTIKLLDELEGLAQDFLDCDEVAWSDQIRSDKTRLLALKGGAK